MRTLSSTKYANECKRVHGFLFYLYLQDGLLLRDRRNLRPCVPVSMALTNIIYKTVSLKIETIPDSLDPIFNPPDEIQKDLEPFNKPILRTLLLLPAIA